MGTRCKNQYSPTLSPTVTWKTKPQSPKFNTLYIRDSVHGQHTVKPAKKATSDDRPPAL